jgi:NADPH:quinone reductase-like Zn-dependent oxidoreductase
MKAIIKTQPRPPEVLQPREVEKPAPKPSEVLIRIQAAKVTRGDVLLRRLPGVENVVLVVRNG